MMQFRIAIPLSAALLFAVGCASSGVTPEQVAAPRAAIEAAQELGARDIPQADLHLKMAEDQYAFAKKLIKEDETERAKLVLDRAYYDAKLARELARQAITRQQADAAQQQIQKLQEQMP